MKDSENYRSKQDAISKRKERLGKYSEWNGDASNDIFEEEVDFSLPVPEAKKRKTK